MTETARELAGQVALVTGASRGIGKAIAVELAERGADVALVARTYSEKSWLPGTLTDTAHAVEARGRRAVPIRADLSRAEDVQGVIDEARKGLGRVDILVNNAAYLGRATYFPIEELSLKDWDRQFAVNVTAPFLLSKAFAPEMAARGSGRIINVTSGAGNAAEIQVPGLTYGSTKAALNVFTIALNRDLRPSGAAALILDPGYTRTEIAEFAEQASGTDIDQAHPAELPAKAAAYLATCPDPRAYGGRVIVATELVRTLGLYEIG